MSDKPKKDPVDPFDPTNFAVSPAALSALQGDVGVAPVITGLSVRKPAKQEFFRVNPDPAYSVIVPILELKDERETYLVAPQVAVSLPGDVVMRELRLCQNRLGVLFIWPVPVIDENAKGRNDWHVSARQIMTLAQSKWVRMAADISAGRYNAAIGTGIPGEPIWAKDLSMRDLLELAFGKQRLITELAHPLVKRLQGLE